MSRCTVAARELDVRTRQCFEDIIANDGIGAVSGAHAASNDTRFMQAVVNCSSALVELPLVCSEKNSDSGAGSERQAWQVEGDHEAR